MIQQGPLRLLFSFLGPKTPSDYKESWMQKNWCFWTVVLEKTLESPLDGKEFKPVSAKGNQSWIFTGRTDAEAETPILWPPDVKSWLTGKDSDTGKDWRQEKGTEDEMVGWHHRLNGHEFEQAPGVGDGQEKLVCYSPWGRKGWDTTQQLNWSEWLTFIFFICFLPLGWFCLRIWGYRYFSLQSWFQLVLHPAWHFAWCTLHRS